MATGLSGFPLAAGQAILSSSSTQQHPLGAYMETPDGRGFRYFKNGAVATVPGKVYQGTALDATNMQPSGGITPAAAATGDVTVTLSTSLTLTLNQLAGGYMSVDITPGQGYTYRVKGNTAVAGATGCVVTLEDPIVIPLTTASRVIFVAHPYSGLVIEPGTPTAAIAGVPTYIVAASEYGWIQTKGPCSVLFVGTGVAGKAVGSLSGGTSGAVAPAIAATNIIGYHMATGITTEYAMVNLCLG